MNSFHKAQYSGASAVVGLVLAIAIFGQVAMAQTAQHYKQTNLTSNQASLAPIMDGGLVNSWGLARSSTSPWWVADNGTGLSTLYNATGEKQGLVVTIPTGDNAQSPTGTPTGTVFNGDSTVFLLAPGKAAAFLFVTEDGTISAWNPGVSLSQAVIEVNHKSASVYKGVTIATVQTKRGPQTYLYAADFRQGRVEVFDSTFKPVQLQSDNDDDNWGSFDHERGEGQDGGSFEDPRLPRGYAPFNVQNIGGNIYVSFAKQDSAKHDEVHGAGMGFVDVFSPRGRLLGRLQSGPWFNAPWGLTLASSDFGAYSHDVLVGQFGSGTILAFDPVTGKFKGMLNGADNNPIHIDGLWAIAFGNDASAGPATTLYFTAGPDDETNGLFGTLTAVENVQGNDQ
ncbi:MAG TPA: TIGR03118 family protein [Edaphobacter sp.]|nr:TIGR03118 family protein [Edaphobacter sp.]